MPAQAMDAMTAREKVFLGGEGAGKVLKGESGGIAGKKQ